MSRSNAGGLLVTSFKSGTGGNSIHAVLTDEFGNGGCTGISVTVQWTEYTPTIFNHSSTQQTGHNLSSWITPTTQPALTRQFVCCTYPVDASYGTLPGNALGYTFYNTSTGGGTATWTIEGSTYSGDTVEHSFSAPGYYTVCLTVEGVCEEDTDCQEIAVATVGMNEQQANTGLRLWPQPTSGEVSLTSEQPLRAVELLDAAGRVVLHQGIDQRLQVDIDLTGLPAGVFVLRAWTSTGLATQMLVKE
jgi:hypothetical protein